MLVITTDVYHCLFVNLEHVFKNFMVQAGKAWWVLSSAVSRGMNFVSYGVNCMSYFGKAISFFVSELFYILVFLLFMKWKQKMKVFFFVIFSTTVISRKYFSISHFLLTFYGLCVFLFKLNSLIWLYVVYLY